MRLKINPYCLSHTLGQGPLIGYSYHVFIPADIGRESDPGQIATELTYGDQFKMYVCGLGGSRRAWTKATQAQDEHPKAPRPANGSDPVTFLRRVDIHFSD